MTTDAFGSLRRQAIAYGAQIRRAGPARSKLDASMRKSRTQTDEVYNDALREGWEREDAEIKAQRRRL